MSRHIDGEDGHTAGICDRCTERFEQRVKDPEFKQRVADSIAELDAAMLAGGPPAAQQNYVVRLVGLVSTDVEVCASSPEAAAEKAEAWAQGKHDKEHTAMSTTTEGLIQKYDVQRTDGKPLKGGRCIVLEVGDPNTHAALLTWADTVEREGFVALAADVRVLVAEVRAGRAFVVGPDQCGRSNDG